MEDVYRRLQALPIELRAARELEYSAFVASRRAAEQLEHTMAHLLLTTPPDGRNQEERRHQAVFLLAEDPDYQEKKVLAEQAAQDLELARQHTKMLEDEFSSLRSVVRLMVGQMLLYSSGLKLEDVPIIDTWIDRKGGRQ